MFINIFHSYVEQPGHLDLQRVLGRTAPMIRLRRSESAKVSMVVSSIAMNIGIYGV